MKEMLTLLSIADHAEWWPEILRHSPKEEENGTIGPEQALLWNAIKSGKASWVAALRTAIDTVIDRIAWTAIRELIPEYEVMHMNHLNNALRPTNKLRAFANNLRNYFTRN